MLNHHVITQPPHRAASVRPGWCDGCGAKIKSGEAVWSLRGAGWSLDVFIDIFRDVFLQMGGCLCRCFYMFFGFLRCFLIWVRLEMFLNMGFYIFSYYGFYRCFLIWVCFYKFSYYGFYRCVDIGWGVVLEQGTTVYRCIQLFSNAQFEVMDCRECNYYLCKTWPQLLFSCSFFGESKSDLGWSIWRCIENHFFYMFGGQRFLYDIIWIVKLLFTSIWRFPLSQGGIPRSYPVVMDDLG